MTSDYSSSDFFGYEPSTKDPGWSFTFVVVTICILMNLMILVLVRRVSFGNDEGNEADGLTKDENNDLKPTPVGSVLKGASPSVVSSHKHLTASQIATAQNEYPHSIRPQGLFPLTAPSVVSEAASVHSRVSSTVFSQAATMVLGARPTKTSAARVGRRRRNPNSKRIDQHRNRGEENADGNEDENASVGGRSVLSMLDQDAVSVMDAVDANDAVVLEKVQHPSSFWIQLLEIADWDSETKRLVNLTIPYTIQGLAEAIFDIITVAVIGHFLGVMEANVYIVVSLLTEFTGTITYGFSEGKFLCGLVLLQTSTRRR